MTWYHVEVGGFSRATSSSTALDFGGNRWLTEGCGVSAMCEQNDSGDKVVLLDEAGQPLGCADKSTVHGATTAYHLAFSCFGFDQWGRLLVTRRSALKKAFPLVWTGTCCGHPAPGERVEDAVRRRLRDELGVRALGLELVLPRFSYRASDGRVEENELCPVYVCTIVGAPRPDVDEVAQWSWWSWSRFLGAARDDRSGLSPWSRLQAPLLVPYLSGATPEVPTESVTRDER